MWKKNITVYNSSLHKDFYAHANLLINNIPTLVSCMIKKFSELTISIVEVKNIHLRRVLPVFRAFPVQGPTITSRAVAREVMVGPKDRKCPKNGQNRGRNGYSITQQ